MFHSNPPCQYLIHLLRDGEERPLGTFFHRGVQPLDAALQHFNQPDGAPPRNAAQVGDYFVVQDLVQLFAPSSVFEIEPHSYKPRFDRRFDASNLRLFSLMETLLEEALTGGAPAPSEDSLPEPGDPRTWNYHEIPFH